MTSKEYWENLHFEYAETFSLLQREEKKGFYDSVQEKAKNAVSEIEKQYWLKLSSKGNRRRLIETGLLHPTAKITNRFLSIDRQALELGNILSTEFTVQSYWMCTPIFREAVVFYDKENQVVDILHICLSCSRIENDQDILNSSCGMAESFLTGISKQEQANFE